MAFIDQFRLLGDERLYVRARIAFNAGLLAMFIWESKADTNHELLTALLVLATTLGTAYVILQARDGRLGTAAMQVLFPDLIVLALLTNLFHGNQDAFYPAVILLAVTYSLVVKRRQAWIAAAGITIAYALGHAFYGFSLVRDAELIARVISLPLLALLVASTVEHRRQREIETAAAVGEAGRLNREMRQRISELQAVAQITETIHSSLDFDRVGPVLLDILANALNVDACCLFVIDKDKSDTLFSASHGVENGLRPATLSDIGVVSEHFTCTSVFEHQDVMVLFCSTAEQIDELSEQDRLVLGAVASELVVAVENSRLYKLTKTLAVTDELTGLSNYRYLQQKLDEEIDRARRYDKRLSLLMIDVDDFKGFNDVNGHLAGDVALAELGQVVRSTVREVDVVARYGGEEFSVLLPETDAAGAFVAAEKIREAVAEYSFADATGKRRSRLTVSIGLATMPTHAADKETLLREADDAVYNAKHGGKDRVRAAWKAVADGEAAPQAMPEAAAEDEWTGE